MIEIERCDCTLAAFFAFAGASFGSGTGAVRLDLIFFSSSLARLLQSIWSGVGLLAGVLAFAAGLGAGVAFLAGGAAAGVGDAFRLVVLTGTSAAGVDCLDSRRALVVGAAGGGDGFLGGVLPLAAGLGAGDAFLGTGEAFLGAGEAFLAGEAALAAGLAVTCARAHT